MSPLLKLPKPTSVSKKKKNVLTTQNVRTTVSSSSPCLFSQMAKWRRQGRDYLWLQCDTNRTWWKWDSNSDLFYLQWSVCSDVMRLLYKIWKIWKMIKEKQNACNPSAPLSPLWPLCSNSFLSIFLQCLFSHLIRDSVKPRPLTSHSVLPLAYQVALLITILYLIDDG